MIDRDISLKLLFYPIDEGIPTSRENSDSITLLNSTDILLAFFHK